MIEMLKIFWADVSCYRLIRGCGVRAGGVIYERGVIVELSKLIEVVDSKWLAGRTPPTRKDHC